MMWWSESGVVVVDVFVARKRTSDGNCGFFGNESSHATCFWRVSLNRVWRCFLSVFLNYVWSCFLICSLNDFLSDSSNYSSNDFPNHFPNHFPNN